MKIIILNYKGNVGLDTKMFRKGKKLGVGSKRVSFGAICAKHYYRQRT